MPVEIIQHEHRIYPAFQAQGFAAQFAIPFAKHFCKGTGVDVGCGKLEWCFPGAIPIDPSIKVQPNGEGYHATNFPYIDLDYVFSSHCLEHIVSWVEVLDYWYKALKVGGVIFLYLPDYSQTYWRPWNNRKHVNVHTPQVMVDYFMHKGCKNIFVSGVDLNSSFMIVAEKRDCITPSNDFLQI